MNTCVYLYLCLTDADVSKRVHFCQTQVLGLGVDFTFAWDNDNNDKNHKNDKNDNNNPHLNFLKGTVLGDKG